jgi:hypothetical protein
VRAEEELFPSPLILHIEHPFLGEKVFFSFMRQWILQLRASPCVQNDLGVRCQKKRRNPFIKVYIIKTARYEPLLFLIKDRNQSKTNACSTSPTFAWFLKSENFDFLLL